jgi:L-lactate dehydrogenase complex protein LldG
MSGAREDILRRIRTELGPATDGVTAYSQIAREYQRGGTLDREGCLHLLKDRLLDYDSEIYEVANESEIAGAIHAALQHADEHRLLVAEAFPKTWLPNGVDVVVDAQLTIAQLDSVTTVVTTCEAVVASTGTVILVHDGAQGRRAITLLPDHHICIVQRNQVYETLPEALTAIAGRSKMAITTISGPSATSDIEMTRIRGVHGPRRLTVVLCGPTS